MVKELTEGIEGTGVRATVIGEIGTSKDITETEAKVFRAASAPMQKRGHPSAPTQRWARAAWSSWRSSRALALT